MNKKHTEWATKQAKAISKRARARWGNAWILLSPDQQDGEIAREIVNLLAMQDTDYTMSEDKLDFIEKFQSIIARVMAR